MNLLFRLGFHLSALAASLAIGCFTPVSSLLAAESSPAASTTKADQESVKIEPYTGPPIFLNEAEKVAVAPTVVTHEIIKQKLGDGRLERQVAHLSDDSVTADGTYREFYPNDKPFIEGQFVKGKQEGEWKYYFDNGQINRKVIFKDGKPNGAWEVYRADGTLQAKRGFKDGIRDGEWISYDDSGKKPLVEEHYAKGLQDGTWKTWYPSGQLRTQITFKNGKRDGTSSEWNDKGQLVVEAHWTDDKLNGDLTRVFADGHKVVQKFDAGKLVSESK